LQKGELDMDELIIGSKNQFLRAWQSIISTLEGIPLIRKFFALLAVDSELHGVPASGVAARLIEARALPMNQQRRIVAGIGVGALLLIVLFVAGSSLVSYFSASKSAEESGADDTIAAGTFKPTPAQLASVVIKPVGSLDFASVTDTDGYIASDDDLTTPVFSPFSGRVVKVIAKLGDTVKKGDPLMVVEASEFVQAQNDLITAVSGLHSTDAQLNLAVTNEKRQHELYDARGAALKDWQQSQSDLATAQGNYRTAEIALAAVRNRLRIFGKSDQEIDAMERAPVGAQTSPDAVVTAPIDGTVLLKGVGLGQYIQSGAGSPVYSIGDLSTVWLIANVREEDAPQMHVGDPADVRVLALPERVFKAKITYVAPAIDPNTHRLQVRADIPNANGLLKPQMFASFSITTGKYHLAAPAVPQSAIVAEGETSRVWVMNRDGTLGLREIRTGRSNGEMVEVLCGVSAQDKVVTRGAIFIDRASTSE
jgi:cobalt-zinc-cadmium efflux system membrane fusion protein